MAVPPEQGIDNVMMAHVHVGLPGINGPIAIDLMAGGDFSTSPASSSAEGTVVCSRALFARMLANPGSFYFNFHTAADPLGAVRGVLSQAAVQFSAELSGSEETTVVDANAAGSFDFFAGGIFNGSFTLTMAVPPAVEVQAAHIHDGVAGVDGPVLVDLLADDSVELSGDTFLGDAFWTGRTLARLLAAAERFYCNVHTIAAPNGIARGQLELQIATDPPANLAYTSPVTYTECIAITANVPTSDGGPVALYEVAPALPAGLTLNAVTGVISGTPLAPAAQATYTVTAGNEAGEAEAEIDLVVEAAEPTNLTYTSPVTYAVDVAIAANSPSNEGGAIDSYSVDPALPAGLSLHTTTGVISGTPTAAVAAANYTVTGTNAAGSTTFAVNITVEENLQPPLGLSYSAPSPTYGTGTAISPNTATIGGGAVETWSVSPALPNGLSLHATNGTISGTPTQITSAANYTVTATNDAGSTNAVVNITIVLGAPSALTYSNEPAIVYQNTAMTAMSPSSQGGTVASYAVDTSDMNYGALPAGITLNTTTGVISGTPTGVSNFTQHVIVATNAAGSTSATISIYGY